ncbi:MAG: glycosyltransferase [Candidatus Eisenbacteria bacterium]|nr:glycosyltransferase [Candidatus Latescibacterota bacterium]MBD3302289.1 glycosyltransferase [Candidatus Eisenbacteria bacterium]
MDRLPEDRLPRVLVIVPTYNERENIEELLPKILASGPNLEVLVVDDASPDGTGKWVEEQGRRIPRVHCLRRPEKRGLGSAYVDGFRIAIEREFDLVFEMDADFSHDPAAIPEFLEAARRADLVLGSRYLHGVTVVNWPLRRLMLSYGANCFSRFMTGLPVKDATGGFKCFRREVLEAIDLDTIKSDGYSFQIEVSFHAWRLGFRIVEIPILFVDRRVGISKMNRKIIVEALAMVFHLSFLRIFTRKPRRETPRA